MAPPSDKKEEKVRGGEWWRWWWLWKELQVAVQKKAERQNEKRYLGSEVVWRSL